MRKTFVFILLLIQFSCATPPQAPSDTLTFKIQYKPEKTYRLTTERTSQTVIEYAGREISLQRLKARGIANPTISNKKIRKETVMKTGKLNDSQNFPCTAELIRTINSDGKKDISDGAIFAGQCSIGEMPAFHAVKLDGLDEKYKRSLIQAIQNSLSQLDFPEKKLKIGEQFSVENPLSIPMEGSTVEMVVTTNYKLISISNGKANFEVSQIYAMNPTLMDNSFHGTGSGKGQILYDIANQIALKNTLATEIEINKKLDSFDFHLKAKSESVQTTTIAAK
jgi:hypothetical protein